MNCSIRFKYLLHEGHQQHSHRQLLALMERSKPSSREKPSSINSIASLLMTVTFFHRSHISLRRNLLALSSHLFSTVQASSSSDPFDAFKSTPHLSHPFSLCIFGSGTYPNKQRAPACTALRTGSTIPSLFLTSIFLCTFCWLASDIWLFDVGDGFARQALYSEYRCKNVSKYAVIRTLNFGINAPFILLTEYLSAEWTLTQYSGCLL